MADSAELLKAFKSMKQELSSEIQQVRTDVTQGIEAAVTNALKPLDDRLQKCETMMASFEARLQAMEKPTHTSVGEGTAAKRARSVLPNISGVKSVVLCGFPRLSRKPDVEEFVKERLKQKAEWAKFDAFAPNVRGTIVIVKIGGDEAARQSSKIGSRASSSTKGLLTYVHGKTNHLRSVKAMARHMACGSIWIRLIQSSNLTKP